MATGYKEPNTYKGFEQWWHATQMSLKMYIYCFIALLLLHLMIPVLYFILFEPQIIGLFLNAIFSLQLQYLPKFLKFFIRAGWFIFILATPIWLLYPFLLKKFKARAKKITQDEHLRGTQLIADEELAKIIKKEIKEKGGIL